MIAITEVEPQFIVDWNEVGRLGALDGCTWVDSGHVSGYPRNFKCSWFRTYNEGDWLTVYDDEEHATVQCQVVTADHNHRTQTDLYLVRPDWGSYTAFRLTS